MNGDKHVHELVVRRAFAVMEASAAADTVTLKHITEDDTLLPVTIRFTSSIEGDVDFADWSWINFIMQA